MKMNAGKTYCANYRNLAKQQEIVKRKNSRLYFSGKYEKYALPQDNSNCDSCDTFPSLMANKICFRLRFKWRLLNFLKGG